MEEKRDALMAQARALALDGDCPGAAKAALEALDLDPALPEAHMIQARCELKAEKRAEAAAHFTKALELAPDTIEALVAMARISLLKHDADAAAAHAQRAWDLGERSRELTVLRAGVFMAREEFAEAKPLLEEAVASDPADEEAMVGLASAYINTDDSAKAKELLQSGLKNFPQSPAVLNLLLNLGLREQDWPLALDCLKRLATLDPDNADLALQQADVMIRSGQEAEVQNFLTAFLQGHPGALKVRLSLISHAVTLKQFDEALALVAAAPEQGGELKMIKANVLSSAGRVDECAEVLREISRDPAYAAEAPQAHQALAEIYLRQERLEEGGKELDALLALQPDNAGARMTRGKLRLSQRDAAGAIEDFEAVVDKNPDNLGAILALADAQFVAGNPALAENLVTGVIQRKPDLGQAYLSLANLYLMQNKPEAALVTLRLGKVSAPDNNSIDYAEVDLLISLKRYKEAEKALTALAEDNKEAENAYFALATVYGLTKEHKKAAAAYEKILALNPERHQAAEGRIRALIAGKQEKAALAFAEKRATARPKDPASAYMLGEAALAARDLPKAEKAFMKAHNLKPEWDRPLMTMSQIYAATKRMDKAIELCRKAMVKVPEAPGPGMILAMLHEQKGDLRSAEDVYRGVLSKHPELLAAANNLAFIITRRDATPERLAEAEELAQKAASSGQPQTLDTLGWIQHLRGNSVEAEKNLRAALEGDKDNQFMAYHLAAILAAQKDPAKIAEARKLLGPLTGKSSKFALKKEAEALLKKLPAK